MSDRPAGRPVPPLARASARKRAYADDGTNDGTSTEHRTMPRTGTLANRMPSARDVAAILTIPERTVRDKNAGMGTACLQDRQAPALEGTGPIRAWIDRQAA